MNRTCWTRLITVDPGHFWYAYPRIRLAPCREKRSTDLRIDFRCHNVRSLGMFKGEKAAAYNLAGMISWMLVCVLNSMFKPAFWEWYFPPYRIPSLSMNYVIWMGIIYRCLCGHVCESECSEVLAKKYDAVVKKDEDEWINMHTQTLSDCMNYLVTWFGCRTSSPPSICIRTVLALNLSLVRSFVRSAIACFYVSVFCNPFIVCFHRVCFT